MLNHSIDNRPLFASTRCRRAIDAGSMHTAVAVLHTPEVNGCVRTLKVEFLLMLQDARAPEAVHHVLCLRLQDLVQQRRSCHGAVPP